MPPGDSEETGGAQAARGPARRDFNGGVFFRYFRCAPDVPCKGIRLETFLPRQGRKTAAARAVPYPPALDNQGPVQGH